MPTTLQIPAWRSPKSGFDSSAAMSVALGVGVCGLLALAGCQTGQPEVIGGPPPKAELVEVARFPGQQVTGVAVGKSGRVFVSFPRWHDDFRGVSVAELMADGSLRPIPDARWNSWMKDPPVAQVGAQAVAVAAVAGGLNQASEPAAGTDGQRGSAPAAEAPAQASEAPAAANAPMGEPTNTPMQGAEDPASSSDGASTPPPSPAPAAAPAPVLPVGPDLSWVCVQSVVSDRLGRLWVLDPGSPKFGGVVPGAAKLVELSPDGNTVVRTIAFDDTAAPTKSYLNDVRIDVEFNHAYITDSGLGGIVVVNLADGSSRRVLSEAKPMLGEPSVIPVVQGIELRQGGTPESKPLVVHSDGIALDEVRGMLYIQALTARTLYRIRTSVLRDANKSAEQVLAAVETVGETVAADGMEADEKGNVYLTALEQQAIVVRLAEGRLITLAEGPELAWPDSLAFGPGGWLYVTTSQIHKTQWFNAEHKQPGDDEPYRVLKIRLPEGLRRLR